MTNEEALKTLKENLCALCAYGSQNMESCDIRSCDNKDAIKVIEKQIRWIPISERLPEVPDCYVVTEKIGSDLINSVCFFDRPNTWYNDNRKNYERNCLTNIVAWMPLPAPYKSQESEEE